MGGGVSWAGRWEVTTCEGAGRDTVSVRYCAGLLRKAQSERTLDWDFLLAVGTVFTRATDTMHGFGTGSVLWGPSAVAFFSHGAKIGRFRSSRNYDRADGDESHIIKR